MRAVLAVLAVLAAVATASFDDTMRPRFKAWMRAQNVAYDSQAEFEARLAVFAANAAFVDNHPADSTFTVALNRFADRTAAEFAAHLRSSTPLDGLPTRHAVRGASPPASWDWCAHGACVPVPNQGELGGESLSTTVELESAYAAAKGSMVQLSMQELVDCVPSGQPEDDWAWVSKNGLCSAADYPSNGMAGPCAASKCQPAVTIASLVQVDKSDAALMAAIATSPTQVYVDASSPAFQFYSGGVITNGCGTAVDHVVTAVGYGTLSGQDYYKLQNTWGVSWGDQGFVLVGRGAQVGPNGECGLLSVSSVYPTFA